MTRRAFALLLLAPLWLPAATLEQLSLDDLIRKSTAVVRGRVLSSYTSSRGALLYTHSRIQVLESWKGASGAEVNVAIPGGAMNGFRQAFSGAPKLTEGSEYVLFLWAGKSGMIQVIGFSQGVFGVTRDGQGESVNRAAATETMLNSSGRPVEDADVRMSLAELRDLVRRTLASPQK